MSLEAQAELNLEETRINIVSPYRCRELVKELPGARWNVKEKVWTVSKSWPACLALRAEFGEGLTIGPKLAQWAREAGKLKKELASLYGATRKDDLEVPDLPFFDRLMPHQKVDAWAIAHAKRYNLFNQPGVGKSLAALAGVSWAQHLGQDVFPALLVAPKSMLTTWARDEVPRVFPEASISVVDGTAANVRKALEPGFDIYIIGWSLLAKYTRLGAYGSMPLTDEQKVEKQLNTLGFKTIICDECHRVSNPTTLQSRAAHYVSSSCDMAIGLTGTPVQENVEDLYSILHTVVPNDYPTKTTYFRWVEFDWGAYGGKEIVGIKESRKDEWEANFHAVSRRMTTDMVLDFLPPVLEETRWVTLPSKMRKAYDSMQKTLVAELENSTLSAENQLVRTGRLIQLANAFGEVDDEGQFHMTGPSPKIDSFISDYLDGDYDGEQIIVFSDSRQLADLLLVELTKKKIKHVAITGGVTGEDRQKAMDAFQKDGVPVCVLTRAGGEGITLTAASTMVRLVRPWSYTVYQQVNARCRRVGSEKHDSIRYVDYLSESTMELGQLLRLNAKKESATEVLGDDELLRMLKGN